MMPSPRNYIAFLGNVAALLAMLSLAACAASRPMVYPNARAEEVGSAVVQADIDACMARADDFVSGRSRGGEVAKKSAGRAVVGAGVGAAAGAAGGAVSGDAGRGAAAGAAGGAAAGVASGLLEGLFGRREPDPVFKNFVTRCLQEKGYEVIGWD